MSFHPRGGTGLTVYLAIGQKDGGVHEETFSYTLPPPDAR